MPEQEKTTAMAANTSPVLELKPWGLIRRFIDNPTLRVEEIEIVPGGFSSIHCHLYQRNQFHVLSGELMIRVFDPRMLVMAMMGRADLTGRPRADVNGRIPGSTPGSLKSLAESWSGDNYQDVVDSGTCYVLRAGDSITIESSTWHQFEAAGLESGERVKAVEIYNRPTPSGYVSGECSGIRFSGTRKFAVDAGDILRITANGVKAKNEPTRNQSGENTSPSA